MKFLRRKENKSDSLPPPPVVLPTPPPPPPPQFDALPPPPPPLYARFATASSSESIFNTTLTPRLNSSTTAPQSRNSVAPSVKTTSTNSGDVQRATATATAQPVIRLVNKPRSDDTTTTSQPLRTDSRTSPPTPAYRRETSSSSESTRLLKPKPPSTSNLPNPFLPPLLRQKNSGTDIATPESFPATLNAGTQQGFRDATQKRIGERSQLFGILGRLTLTNTYTRSGHPR